MSNQKNHETYRAYILIALHGTMALLAVMILYALFALQDQFSDRLFAFYGTAASGLISVYLNGKATGEYVRILQAKAPMPPMALVPFLFMAITLMLAGRLFGSV